MGYHVSGDCHPPLSEVPPVPSDRPEGSSAQTSPDTLMCSGSYFFDSFPRTGARRKDRQLWTKHVAAAGGTSSSHRKT